MEQATGINAESADITKLLEKLTEQVTSHVHTLHELREAVTDGTERHRSATMHLRDLENETAEAVEKEKRTRTDEAFHCRQYETQLRELKKDIDDRRKAIIVAEMNYNLLAAIQDQVTQKEIELAELRREVGSRTESACFSADVTSSLIKQISFDVEQMEKRVREAKKDMKESDAKRTEARKIINDLRAYVLTEKNAKLEIEYRVKALCFERRKEKEIALASKQGQVRLRQVVPSPEETSRLAILKELQEEEIRSAFLTKQLTVTTQLAAEKAAKRKQWLEKQFAKDDDDTQKDDVDRPCSA